MEFNGQFQFFQQILGLSIALDPELESADLLHHLLGLLVVFPETRIGRLLLFVGDLYFFLVQMQIAPEAEHPFFDFLELIVGHHGANVRRASAAEQMLR